MADDDNGKKKKNGRKKGDPNNRGRAGKSAEQFMGELVPHGHIFSDADPETVTVDFTARPVYVDPVSFCQAVINGDNTILTKCGVVEIPTLEDKLEAARIAVKYTNNALPTKSIMTHEFSWGEQVSKAEQRLRELRMEAIRDRDREPEIIN